MTTQLSTTILYERDYYLWLEITLKQLQEKDIDYLDWQHLIEEIDALGNEQRHKVESYLRQILKHLLFYQYWSLPDCRNHWEVEIDNFRVELRKLIESKTLYNYLLSILEKTYQDALRQAKKKSGLNCFPKHCPYSSEEILDVDWLPLVEL